MPLLRVTDLKVGYERVPILHGISFEVEQGEIAAILGPNGAGKTTTLSAVVGLLRPWEGTVEFDGKDITGSGPDHTVAIGMAMAPEGRRVFPALSVEENLRLGGWAVRRDGAKFRGNLERVYEIFEILGQRRGQLAGTLSGGEQQMLAIGRALMSSPTLLIIDEAALGLAPVMVDRVFQTIQEIRAAGSTILLVEQNAPATLAVADRVYLMQGGAIATGGPAAEIREAGVLDAYLGPMAAAARRMTKATQRGRKRSPGGE